MCSKKAYYYKVCNLISNSQLYFYTYLCCSLAHDVDNVEWALHLMSKDAGTKGGLGLHLLGPRQGVALGAGDAHGQKTLLIIRNHVTILSVNLKMKDVF